MKIHSVFLVTSLAMLTACSHAETEQRSAATGALTPEPGSAGCEECNGKETVPDSTKVESFGPSASPVRGAPAAPITIVEFADFECSFCAKSEATLREVEASYGGKVKIVFKNAPLPMHPHARLAAKAALAAGEQGKFWEYHDALYAQPEGLERPALEALAQKLGLDGARFRTALDSKELDAAIDADLAEAKRVGVRGTPAFFVNGRNLQGAQPLPAFKAKIDQALAER